MDKEQWWTVCIGVPYATHLWQVADSSEQNGCFKMALMKLKRQISETRNDMKFYPTDIILLVRKAWDLSFGRIEANKRAICARGWNPLNRALFLHPKIAVTKNADADSRDIAERTTGTNQVVITEKTIPNNMFIEKLHREHVRQYAASGKAKEERDKRQRQKELQGKLRKTTSSKRYTSTALTAQGQYNLNIEYMVADIQKKQAEAEAMESEKQQKRIELDEKQQFENEMAVKKYKNNNHDHSKLTARELKACVVMMPGESPVKAKKEHLAEQFERRLSASQGMMPPVPLPKLKDPPKTSTVHTDDVNERASV